MLINLAQFQMFFLAFTRVMAILSFMPVLGGQNIPVTARIVVGFLFTFMLSPWSPLPADADSMNLIGFTIAMVREIAVGVLTGYTVTLTLGAVQIAGEMIGMSAGFGSARFLNPTLGESGSIIDQFLSMITLMLLLIMNAHHDFLIAIRRTFEALPVAGAMPPFSLERTATLTGNLIASGFQIGMPIVAALLIADLTLGLLSRVAPQVQVFFLGLPLKIAIGLLGLSVAMSVMLPRIAGLVEQIGPRMLRLIGG